MNISEEGVYAFESQIRECYAKVAWTFTSFQEEITEMSKVNKRIFLAKILASSTSTFFAVCLLKCPEINATLAAVLVAVCSGVVAALELFYKEAGLQNKINEYTCVASKLWAVRESYISLLTDIHMANVDWDGLKVMRDGIQAMLEKVYAKIPRTSQVAYDRATEKLHSEASTLHEDEIDHILPIALRRNKEKV